MLHIKVSTLALPFVSALLLTGSAASAAESATGQYVTFWGGSHYSMSEAVAKKARAHKPQAAQSKLRDNNAPTASLSAREFFERLSSRSR